MALIFFKVGIDLNSERLWRTPKRDDDMGVKKYQVVVKVLGIHEFSIGRVKLDSVLMSGFNVRLLLFSVFRPKYIFGADVRFRNRSIKSSRCSRNCESISCDHRTFSFPSFGN